MKKIMLLSFLLLFSMTISLEAKTVQLIGDSRVYYGGAQCVIPQSLQVGWEIIAPCAVTTFGGKALRTWYSGDMWTDCLQDEPCPDAYLIYSLGINDMFTWHNKTSGAHTTITGYIDEWVAFIAKLNAKCPSAKIIHVTTYPLRTDDTPCPENEGVHFYGGPTTALAPDCSTNPECMAESNGSYMYFQQEFYARLSEVANYNFYYLDTFTEILANQGAADTFIDFVSTDCIHISEDKEPLGGETYYYNTYLKSLIDQILVEEKSFAFGGVGLYGNATIK